MQTYRELATQAKAFVKRPLKCHEPREEKHQGAPMFVFHAKDCNTRRLKSPIASRFESRRDSQPEALKGLRTEAILASPPKQVHHMIFTRAGLLFPQFLVRHDLVLLRFRFVRQTTRIATIPESF